jgi:hypothetical protein
MLLLILLLLCYLLLWKLHVLHLHLQLLRLQVLLTLHSFRMNTYFPTGTMTLARTQLRLTIFHGTVPLLDDLDLPIHIFCGQVFRFA